TLIIPGGEGEAVATTYTVQAGDTMASIAAQFHTTAAAIARSNRLVQRQPDLVMGETLPLISRTGSALPQPVTGRPYLVQPGETLLMIAAQNGLAPAELAAMNGLDWPTAVYPGQRLRLPGDAPYRDLPGGWVDVQVGPLPVQQGQTLSIYVAHLDEGRPAGELAGQTLRFAPFGDGFVALVGLDAFTEPGVYELTLSGSGSRPWYPFRQTLALASANYVQQFITIPDEISDLLAPEIRQNEDAFLDTIYTRFREEKLWDGLFQMPVANSVVTAGYGDARSYNGGPFDIFHTGVDFAGGMGTFILAPAAGEVMFVGELTLRGNTVIIDHGLGVMSAYFHLERPLVAVGDRVTTGQQIGVGGNTGLSTGPHLHWDLRVNGVAVDGRQWLETVLPMNNES
ncbi:MAG: peptidoglycan DD-metalloendopeptidase family protein, partial [Anaerolineae bacterium]